MRCKIYPLIGFAKKRTALKGPFLIPFLRHPKRAFLVPLGCGFLFYFATMEHFDTSWLLQVWRDSFYLVPLLFLTTVALTVYTLFSKPKIKLAYVMALLAGMSSIQVMVDTLCSIYMPVKSLKHFNDLCASMYIIIEIICCYLLVMLTRPRIYQRLILNILMGGFILFELIYIISNYSDKTSTSLESMVEFPMIIFFCGIYYYNLLTGPPQKNLHRLPLFWAIGGFAFLALALLPLNIVSDYLLFKNSTYRGLYLIITCICYSLFFICCWRALYLTQKNNVHAKL